MISSKNYKSFQNDIFRAKIDNEFLSNDPKNIECQHFMIVLTKTLNKQAPLKAKYRRVIQENFVSKKLHKSRVSE